MLFRQHTDIGSAEKIALPFRRSATPLRYNATPYNAVSIQPLPLRHNRVGFHANNVPAQRSK
jgi:hypothetical protein